MTQPLIQLAQIDNLLAFVDGRISNALLDDLRDILITTPAIGDVLTYVGGSPPWRNSAAAGGSSIQGGDGITAVALASPETTTLVSVDATVARRDATNIFTQPMSGVATGPIVLQSGAPGIIFDETDAGSPTGRIWRFYAASSDLFFDVRDAANTTSSNWLEVNRTGTVVDTITLRATQVILSGSPGGDASAQTVAASAGGLQAHNLATGSGLERVLTTSDLQTGSPADDALGDLTDVNLGSPLTNNLLYHNGTEWVDTAGALTWDGSTLDVSGTVTVPNSLGSPNQPTIRFGTGSPIGFSTSISPVSDGNNQLNIIVGGVQRFEVGPFEGATDQTYFRGAVAANAPAMSDRAGSSTNVAFAPAANDLNTGLGGGGDSLILYAGGLASIHFREASNEIVQTHHIDDNNTASTTQTQAGALQLLSTWNDIRTVANDGDAVLLGSGTQSGIGQLMVVINNGVNRLQIFPRSGQRIIGSNIDESVFLAPGLTATFLSTFNSTPVGWSRLDQINPNFNVVLTGVGSVPGEPKGSPQGFGSPTTGVIGDVLYLDGTNWVNLNRGTAGQVLTMGSPLLPSWATPSADQNIWLTIAADQNGPVSANTTTDTLTLAGANGIVTSISGDTVTITMSGSPLTDLDQQNLYSTFMVGSPTVVLTADSTATNVTFIAGTGITLVGVGSPHSITITNADPNVDQNLFLNVLSDAGTATADTTTDTLSILGGTSISTSVTDDALTIVNDDPNVDQNIWLTIAADQGGSVAANTTTDTLTLAGANGIVTSISGDTVTITMSGSPLTSEGSPSVASRLVFVGAGSPATVGTTRLIALANGVLQLRSDGDTETEDRLLTATFADGTAMWQIGNDGDDELNIHQQHLSGAIHIKGTSPGSPTGSERTELLMTLGAGARTQLGGEGVQFYRGDIDDAQLIGHINFNGSTEWYHTSAPSTQNKRISTQSGGVVYIHSDGDTDSEIRRLFFTHSDGTERARFGQAATGAFEIANLIDGADVIFTASDLTTTTRTYLRFDPDDVLTLTGTTDVSIVTSAGTEVAIEAIAAGEVILAHAGIDRFLTGADGSVIIKGDTTPSGSPNRVACRLVFALQDGTERASIGFIGSPSSDVSDVFTIQATQIILSGSPVGTTSAQTVAPSAGGLQAHNLATGTGLERVLTTSDLQTGSPLVDLDQQNLFETITVVGSPTVTLTADSTATNVTLTAGTGITLVGVGSPHSVTITNADPNVDQNLWLNIDADSGGPVAANTTTDTITLTGGASITTAISGDVVTFTNDAPNVDQNIWLTIATDQNGPVSANTTTDTLTLAGANGIVTSISGDTVTITMSGSPLTDLDTNQNLYSTFTVVGSPTVVLTADSASTNVTFIAGTNITLVGAGSPHTITISSTDTGDPDQNIWLTIAADQGGSVAANTTTDTLTLAGAGGIVTTISGDTVTITMTGSPFGVGGSPLDPTVARMSIGSPIASIVNVGKFRLEQLNEAAVPTLAFGDGDTGFYEASDDVLEISIGGSNEFTIDQVGAGGIGISGATNTAGAILNTAATGGVPSIIPSNSDINTGLGWSDPDALALLAGGINAIRLSEISNQVIQAHSSSIALVADVGSSQGDGVLLSSYNQVDTVATHGDAVTLPSTFAAGTIIYIKNDGANVMDVFPASGDLILPHAADIPEPLLPGEGRLFLTRQSNSQWTTLLSGPPPPTETIVSGSPIVQATIVTYPAATYRSAELLIQASSGSPAPGGINVHITKIIAIHDGTTADSTEFGTVTIPSFIGSPLIGSPGNSGVQATYVVDMGSPTGSSLRLLATPVVSEPIIFKVAATMITV